MIIKPRDDNKEEIGNKFFDKEKRGRYSLLKEQKAKIILSRENSIRKIDNNIYLVQSQTGRGWYKVQWNGKNWVCDCDDFTKNGHILSCKHIIALNLRLDDRYINIEGQEPKIKKKTYTQNWRAYNQAQVQEFEIFDKFLYQLVSDIEGPDYNGPGRPPLKNSDKIFCCIMKVYSMQSSRRARWLYKEAVQRQQIEHAPHFNVASTTLNKKEITPILYELVHLSARPLASIETDFAYDSSGFRCSTFGNYCEDKHGIKKQRNWLTAHIGTGISSNIVAAVVITDEHAADSPQLKKLLLNTAKNFTIREATADMAYSSQENLKLINSLNGIPYIPFKKNATAKYGGAIWRKSFHYFQLHKEEFLKHYHKRSNVETTFSAIKKKFGESVKSKNRTAQINELLCKIIAYNITVLIREMIELDEISDFLSFDGLKTGGTQ